MLSVTSDTLSHPLNTLRPTLTQHTTLPHLTLPYPTQSHTTYYRISHYILPYLTLHTTVSHTTYYRISHYVLPYLTLHTTISNTAHDTTPYLYRWCPRVCNPLSNTRGRKPSWPTRWSNPHKSCRYVTRRTHDLILLHFVF
jgi:hypothetical protein